MTPPALSPASASLLALLANSAARGLILAVIVGVGLATFRVKKTPIRVFCWTAVLNAAIAMPLLQQVLPPLPIPAPALVERTLKNAPFPVAERRQHAADDAGPARNPKGIVVRGKTQREEEERFEHAASSSLAPAIDTHPVNAPPIAPLDSTRWSVIAAGIYLAVALILFARFLVGLAYGRRLLRASEGIDDARITERLAARASVWDLSCMPQAAESELISVPLTIGALRSTILLPTTWREWDDAQLDAVLTHELSHVVRRDGLTQRLSLLHRAFFWFSPLSWWLDRHLANLAEQASDEAALSSGVDRKRYATILLGFFEALHATPGRVRWQGVSMATAGQAERQAEQRVERILSWKGSVVMKLKRSIAVAVVAIAVPVVYLAASAQPSHHEGPQPTRLGQDQTSSPPAAGTAPRATPSFAGAPAAPPSSDATPAPEPPPQLDPAVVDPALAPSTIHGTIKGGVSGIPAPRLAPAAPISAGVVAPVSAMAPAAPVAPYVAWQASQSETSNRSSAHNFSYRYGFDDEQRFVIVSGKTDALTMSGSTEDARHVEKLRKNIPGDFIWFERDEKSYVIRDQATVDRARKLWDPQEELGKKQEALGKQQEILGKQQEALGAKMQEIRVNVPDMNADLEKLKAELKQLSSGASVDQIGHIQSEIGDLQSKIGDIQSHAGDQQSKLGEAMSRLGEQQGKLGEEQGKLGEQQGKLAEQANRQMKELLDEAITKGVAQPEI